MSASSVRERCCIMLHLFSPHMLAHLTFEHDRSTQTSRAFFSFKPCRSQQRNPRAPSQMNGGRCGAINHLYKKKEAWTLLWSPFRRHTYVSLSQKVHLHWRDLGFTTRQLLQIRDWHSSQRSPRSKIRPRLLRQRVHCRAPKSCGRMKPFCLTSSSSFFSLLRDRNTRRSQDTKKSKRDDGEFKWWHGSPHRILFSSLFLSFSSFCSTFRIISRSCSSRKERFRSFPDCSIDPTVTSYPVMSGRGISCVEGVSKNYIILRCSSFSFSAGKAWIQNSRRLSRISSFIWFYFGGGGWGGSWNSLEA